MYFSSYLFVHCHLNKPQCEICTNCRFVHTFAELYLAPLTAPGSRRLCKDALGRRRWLSSNRLYAPSSVDGGSHTGLSIVHLDFPFQPKQYLLIITFFTSNLISLQRWICVFCVATLVSLLLVSPNVSAAASAGKLGREVIEVPGDLGLDAGIRDLWLCL